MRTAPRFADRGSPASLGEPVGGSSNCQVTTRVSWTSGVVRTWDAGAPGLAAKAEAPGERPALVNLNRSSLNGRMQDVILLSLQLGSRESGSCSSSAALGLAQHLARRFLRSRGKARRDAPTQRIPCMPVAAWPRPPACTIRITVPIAAEAEDVRALPSGNLARSVPGWLPHRALRRSSTVSENRTVWSRGPLMKG